MKPTKKAEKSTKIDLDYMESIIAYNALVDDIYMATVIDVLNPDYFIDRDIRTVFTVVRDFFSRTNTIPNTTEIKTMLVTDEGKNSLKNVINSFSGMDKEFNKDELYRNTEKFIRQKAVYFALKETVEECSDGDKEIDTSVILDRFESACSLSIVENMGMDVFKDIDRNLDKLTNTYRYISTGYAWLDKMMGGGLLHDGRALYAFTGSTNSGKSIILGNLGVRIVKNDLPVLLISMEMSEDVYLKRIASQVTSIPISKLREEISSVKEICIDHITDNPNGRLFIKEYPPSSVNMNNIRAYVKKLIQKTKIKPAVIIIDYINLILPTIITGNSYVDIKRVTEEMRAMSYEFGVPIVSATQLNRTAMDKTNPGMEHTSESMGLSMTVDFQASIWSSDEDKDLGIIHMGLQKNRFGINYGQEAFKIDYDTLIIDTMTDSFTNSAHVGDADTTIQGLIGK